MWPKDMMNKGESADKRGGKNTRGSECQGKDGKKVWRGQSEFLTPN